MKSPQDKLSALFPGLKQVDNTSRAQERPREKPFAERMKRQLAGENQEEEIIDPANPNLIKRD